MFSLKLRFQLINFAHLDDDVHYDAYVDVTTFKKQDRSRLPICMTTNNLSVVRKFIFAFPLRLTWKYLCKC